MRKNDVHHFTTCMFHFFLRHQYHSGTDSSKLCHVLDQEETSFQFSTVSRWWFLISSSFTQKIGETIQFDEHICT